jgi:hypothetical protein
MQKLLLALIVVCEVQAAITYTGVQTTAASTDTRNVTTAAITTSGDTIIVGIGNYQSVGTGGTLSDNKGNTYTALTKQNGGAGGCQVGLYYASNNPVIVGAGHTFSWANGSPNYPTIAVAVFTGGVVPTAMDGQKGSSSATVVSSSTTGAITPTVTSDLWVAGVCISGPTAATPTLGALINSIAGVGGATFGVALSYKVQTSIATEQETWAYSPNAAAGSVIAAFKSLTGVVVPIRHRVTNK